MKHVFLICLLFIINLGTVTAAPDPLPPDDAFQFSAEVLDKEHVRLTWKITQGHYLYKHKFDYHSTNEAIQLPAFQSLSLPQGETKLDPLTNQDTQVYHQNLVLDVPITRLANNKQAIDFDLEAKYQGCAEAGICYPPQKKLVKLHLAALEDSSENRATATIDQPIPVANTTTTEKNPNTENKPKRILTNEEVAVVPSPSDEMFKYNLVALDQKTLVAHWEIKDDHNLYRNRISFALADAENIRLGEPLFPQGKVVEDTYFGTMEVYEGIIDVSLPLILTDPNSTPPKTLKVITEYQGCSNSTGICYPTTKQISEVDLSAAPVPLTDADLDQAANPTPDYSEKIANAGFFGTIMMFLGVGLLLAFTPCIFPMIPILSGVIAGQSDLSARKAFLLSLAYVTASATAYAIIGIVFGLFGANLQTLLQHPISVGIFSGLFVVLALSMFGFFELQMPTSLQTRLNELSNRQQNGSLIGAAIMGFLSTLIVGPCVAPPLAGALTYITQTRDAFLGGVALFTMGFAMGLPLLIVGTSAGHLLPRAGAWMDTTKAIFGMIMLGLAIWMLNRIVPIEITMALVGILLVTSGIYMGALDKVNEEATGWKRFWKSIGLIMVFYGSMQLLGVATGSKNILQPLKGIFTPTAIQTAPETSKKSHFQRISSKQDLDQVLLKAKAEQKIVMLDFYADWCTDCVRMEKNTFPDPRVQKALGSIIALQVDVTKQTEQDLELQKAFGIVGPPTILFFNKNSSEIKNLRLIGYENAEAFTKRLAIFNQH